MRRVPLSNGGFALIDDDDLSRVERYSWKRDDNDRRGYPARTSYACCTVRGRNTGMHRYILELGPSDPPVDHINGDGLDNRRCNLRLASASLNQANSRKRLGRSSSYKGVTKHVGGRWQAQLEQAGVNHYLGLFDSEEDAARAYDSEASAVFGEFARVNFPEVTQ